MFYFGHSRGGLIRQEGLFAKSNDNDACDRFSVNLLHVCRFNIQFHESNT